MPSADRFSTLRLACALALTLLLHAMPASADVGTRPAVDRGLMVRMMALWWKDDFTLPADLAIDPALRSEAEAIAAEQRARAAERMAAWVDDEPAQMEGDVGQALIAQALVARYLNVVALWQLDTTGRAYDAAMPSLLRLPAQPEMDENGIPRVARRLGINGEITFQGRTRTTGTGFDDIRIVRRQLTVPGIRGARAVAFETVFDRATLERAAKYEVPAPARNQDARQTYAWHVD